MTSTPAGSAAFFAISLLTIIVLVLLLLRYYLPLRTTPAYVTVPVFLAIALPASIVILLPIDLASSDGTDTDGNRGIWLPDKVVYKSWRVTYWLTFVLTWFILPLLGEYCDSGYREPKARLLYSLRNNGQYYAIVIGCSIVGSIYLVIWNGMHGETFKSLVMALAYAWGLILGIYLMGHGLVALPRSLYKYANISGRLQRLQGQAPKVHERLTDALEKLDDYESQVMQLKQRKNGVTREYQEWIDELVEKCSLPENRAGAATRTRSTTVPPVITERYLAELTRKLKRARHAKLRFENEWDMIIRRAIKTQAILDSKASQRLEFKNSPFQASNGGWMGRIDLLTPYTRYHLYVHIIPALTYFAWLVTVLASTSLVWSECVREMDGHKLSLVGWSVVHRRDSSRSSIGLGGQVIAAAWLCYMCMCAFHSLTEVKIWGNRALVRRNTYQESATWYGLQVAKLTVPLSYNFLTMTDRPIYTQTSFHKFLGQLINLSPLGKSFSAFFPLFILVPVLATTFGLYKRIRNTCGFGDLLDDEEDEEGQYAGTGSWREGRALIDREIQGASGNVLGLAQRRTTSPPNERYTDHPTPSSNTAATTSEASTSAGRARPERRRPLIDDDDDTGNFFENFATRVKNTFETNDFTFTRPKWLGGEDDAVEAGRARREQERSGGSDRTQGFMSLFGGRADEGRLRL